MLHKIKILLFLLGATLLFSQCSDNDDHEKDNPATPALEEGIQLRINGGAWITLPGTAMKTGDNEYTVSTIVNEEYGDYNSIFWKSAEPTGTFAWNFISEGPEDGNFFQYTPEAGDKNYQSFYVDGKTAHDSPGSLQIKQFGNVGEYVTGTFTIEKAVQVLSSSDVPEVEIVKIEGNFKVKRAE